MIVDGWEVDIVTIREFIAKSMIGGVEDRYFKLIEINAPKVVIESCEKIMRELQSGIVRVSGDTEVLDEEYKKVEVRKGRGGKTYLHINDNVNFFPQAKYGMYIKRV